MSAAPNNPLVEKVALAIRDADNGLDGDPIGVLLDEAPLIDMTTKTRNEADEKILTVCRSAAQAALVACEAEEALATIRLLVEAKGMKDRGGISEAYYAKREEGWRRARALLARVEGKSAAYRGAAINPLEPQPDILEEADELIQMEIDSYRGG